MLRSRDGSDMRMRSRLFVLVLSAVMLLAMGAANASATGAPVYTGVCGGTQVRPKIIDLSVDASGFLAAYRKPGHFTGLYGGRHVPTGRIKWVSWTPNRAVGVGAEWADNDYPNVSQGTFYLFRMNVVLTHPKHGTFTSMNIFTRINVKQHKHEYIPPKHQTLTASGCGHGKWSW